MIIFLSSFSKAETITVDYEGNADYKSIQDAIDNSSDGDSIIVQPGIYNEKIFINKSISIIGKSSNSTIIRNNDVGPVVEIESANINFFNITILNNDSRLSSVNGISLINSSNIYLRSLKFSNYFRNPLLANNVSKLIVTNLSFFNCRRGIFLENINNFSLEDIDFKNQSENAVLGFAWAEYGDARNISIGSNSSLTFGLSMYSCNNITFANINLPQTFQGHDIHLKYSTNITIIDSIFNSTNIYCRSNSYFFVQYSLEFNISFNGVLIHDFFRLKIRETYMGLNYSFDYSNSQTLHLLSGFYNNSDDYIRFNNIAEIAYINYSKQFIFRLENRTIISYNFQEFAFRLSQNSAQINLSLNSVFHSNASINNSGLNDDSYFIDTIINDGWIIQPSVSLVHIKKGEVKIFQIRITPPPNAIGNNTYLFNMTISSISHKIINQSITLTIFINPKYEFSTSIIPPEIINSNGSNSLLINITNTGNVVDFYNITISMFPENWTIFGDLSSFEISPNYWWDNELILQTSLLTSSGVYNFQLIIKSLGGVTQHHNLTFTVPPVYNLSYSGIFEQTAQPGTEIIFNFLIKNEGNAITHVLLISNTSHLSMYNIKLAVEKKISINATVNLQNNLLINDEIIFEIEVFYGNEKHFIIPMKVTIDEYQNLYAEPILIDKFILGEEQHLFVDVINNGNVEENFILNFSTHDEIIIKTVGNDQIAISPYSSYSVELILLIPNFLRNAGKEFLIELQMGDLTISNITVISSSEYHNVSMLNNGFLHYLNDENVWQISVSNDGTVEEHIELMIISPNGWEISTSKQSFSIGTNSKIDVDLIIKEALPNPEIGNIVIVIEKFNLEVSIKTPPISSIDVSPIEIFANEPIEFHAICLDSANFTWYIDGELLFGENVSKSFSESGNYEIILFSNASSGLVYREITRIEVINSPPIASFEVYYEKQRVIFNANSSDDSDGVIVEYNWKINGELYSGQIIPYTFPAPGKYNITLSVRDNSNGLNNISEELDIEKESTSYLPVKDSEGNNVDRIIFIVFIIVISICVITILKMRTYQGFLIKKINIIEQGRRGLSDSPIENNHKKDMGENDKQYLDYRPPKIS